MSLCGSGRVVGSMTLPSLNPTRKPGDAASGQFPAGLRVLVVDDDPTCLKILERMLRTCLYEVTKCDRAEHALNELRRNKNGFDVVLSDVHMPDMDGFKLLEHIGLEMDLPVIMMSADDSKNVVMKGVTHGACDYLIKPVRIEALKNIWQHVVRKKKNEWKDNIEQSGSLEEGDRAPKQEDAEYSSPANEGSWKSSNRKGDDDEGEDKEDSSGLKKPRVVWSVELHQQFVGAVNQLGIDKAVPKKILELMNVPGLTRENVASHLQKYRLYLRRLSGVSHQGGLNSAFMGPQDPSFGTMPALGGFDLQTLAATGQLPGQTLAGYQPGLVRSAVKPGISMPFLDQRNLFSFESPKLRFGEGQHLQQQLSNTNKQMNLLHGIPTTMELKQLPSFHQPTQGIQSSSLLMPMVQPQTRPGQLMNESIGGQISQIQSPIMGQTILSGGGVLPRTGVPDNSQAMMSYGSVSQASSVVDFSVNRAQDMACNSFPLGSTPAITTSKGLIKEEVNSNGKRPRLMGPNYDMFSELPQRKSQDWQGSSLGYGVPQHTSSIGNSTVVSPSILVNQGFSSGQKAGQNLNSIGANSPMFSTDIEVMQQGISTQSSNNALIDNVSLRVKTENVQDMSSGNHLYSYQYAQDDLMSAILKQPESLGSVEGEFDFDGYTIDNILV